MSVGRALGAGIRAVRGTLVRARTRSWQPRSRLFVLGESLGWALDDEAAFVADAARASGYAVAPAEWARHVRGQVLFHTSHFAALDPVWLRSGNAIGLSYFHGRPGTPGFPEFDQAFRALRANAARIERVQVTHAEMHELVLTAGVADERIHRIPIGIELERFPLVTPTRRAEARTALGLPAEAFVVGSFQKDGVGWGEGLEPKTIKGPDVLVAALERIHADAPELVVLLTGPARGFVRDALERAGIRHRHVFLEHRDGLPRAYHALDAYLVASRQEGGPKSILEALATGIPFVSTRAGQVPELVRDGVNGLLADLEDAETLAAGVLRVRDGTEFRAAGRVTAEETAHERLVPRWLALLDGFVARSERR